MTETGTMEALDRHLEAIINENYEKLYAALFRMTENHQDTEDILQNTFIRVMKNIHNFQNRSRLSTWIYRIAVNEGYRHLKSWNKLPVVHITEEKGLSEEEFFHSLEFEPDTDDELVMEELREKCLYGFLKCIPRRMRVCYLLKACLELKNREIAEVLEISESHVKTTLHRARKRLQEHYFMRCSLIDPERPCKCHLWIKYMKDNNKPLPEGYGQFRNDALKERHFRNLSEMNKIDYLYKARGSLSKESFIQKLKNLSEKL